MLIRKSTHDAIVEAKNGMLAESEKLIAKQAVEIGRLKSQRDINASAYRTVCHHLTAAKTEVTNLRAKLARYTAPRQRDAKGHFLPLDRVQA